MTFATSTFRNTLAMPELLSVTRPIDMAKDGLVETARSVINSIVGNVCSFAPVAHWSNLAESYVEFQELLQAYTLSRDSESLTVISDNDFSLPVYCSRTATAFEYYSSLEGDWDGEGAEAPSITALKDANYFLRILGSQIAEAPEARPMLDCDGVPGLFWSQGHIYLSISFYGSFSLTYHYRDEKSGVVNGRTISLEDAEGISKILGYVEEI